MNDGHAVEAEEVPVVGAPAIAGLRFRRYAGAADLTAIVEIMNAAEIADGTFEIESVEALANQLANRDDFVPERDILLAEVHERPVAIPHPLPSLRDGVRVYDSFGHVHPDFRRRGLGRAMLRQAEAELRARAEAESGVAEASLGSWAFEASPGASALLEAEGYTVVRWFFEMERTGLDDLPVAPLPEGLELRPVRPDQVHQIVVADWEAFQDHWGARPFSEAQVRLVEGSPYTDISMWQVAWAGDEVAGSVLPTIFPDDNAQMGVLRGWLDRVSVRRPWRRRGVARALIVAAMAELRMRGMEIASLGVDAGNPTGALGLYEGLGFRAVKRAMAYRKPI